MDATALLKDFCDVAALSGVSIAPASIQAEWLAAPHKPPSSLPPGKTAVYVFMLGHECLKVGKVGPKSQARYVSQHYLPRSSQSNLAKSLLSHGSIADLDESNVGSWIKTHADRYNFILDASLGIPVLTLLESFLQCRLRPRYEGFASQR